MMNSVMNDEVSDTTKVKLKTEAGIIIKKL